MTWASPCNGPAGCWRAPTAASRTVGIATSIRALKKARTQNRALIFTDEASFRQDSTLHTTWSRVGHPPEVPVTGERKNVKILGAVELWSARFHYGQAPVFNAATYLDFLYRLAPHCRRRGAILIQDNASYHKEAEVWD